MEVHTNKRRDYACKDEGVFQNQIGDEVKHQLFLQVGKNPNKHKQRSYLIANPDAVADGKSIKAPVMVTIESREHPVFCFKYLHKDFGINSCDQQQKAALLDKIEKWCSMTWDEIRLAPRKGLGYEKIARGSVKPTIPSFVTKDVDHLLALRVDGLARILVQRRNFVMHIIFIDPQGKCYDHG